MKLVAMLKNSDTKTLLNKLFANTNNIKEVPHFIFVVSLVRSRLPIAYTLSVTPCPYIYYNSHHIHLLQLILTTTPRRLNTKRLKK